VSRVVGQLWSRSRCGREWHAPAAACVRPSRFRHRAKRAALEFVEKVLAHPVHGWCRSDRYCRRNFAWTCTSFGVVESPGCSVAVAFLPYWRTSPGRAARPAVGRRSMPSDRRLEDQRRDLQGISNSSCIKSSGQVFAGLPESPLCRRLGYLWRRLGLLTGGASTQAYMDVKLPQKYRNTKLILLILLCDDPLIPADRREQT
jgi:hypothetical protein